MVKFAILSHYLSIRIDPFEFKTPIGKTFYFFEQISGKKRVIIETFVKKILSRGAKRRAGRIPSLEVFHYSICFIILALC